MVRAKNRCLKGAHLLYSQDVYSDPIAKFSVGMGLSLGDLCWLIRAPFVREVVAVVLHAEH